MKHKNIVAALNVVCVNWTLKFAVKTTAYLPLDNLSGCWSSSLETDFWYVYCLVRSSTFVCHLRLLVNVSCVWIYESPSFLSPLCFWTGDWVEPAQGSSLTLTSLSFSLSLTRTHVAMSKYLDVHSIFTTSKLHCKNERFCSICLLLMLPRLKC